MTMGANIKTHLDVFWNIKKCKYLYNLKIIMLGFKLYTYIYNAVKPVAMEDSHCRP